MKTLQKTIYYSMLCMALVFMGCNKDDENNEDDGGGTAGAEFVTAKVDGADFEAAQDPAVIVSGTVNNAIMSFQGGKNNGETIRATVNNYSGVGTYTTGDDIQNANSLNFVTLTPIATWGSTFNIGSGTIEVTSDDGITIEGTFSFEGFNAADQTTKSITEGKFKAVLEN